MHAASFNDVMEACILEVVMLRWRVEFPHLIERVVFVKMSEIIL